MADSAQRSDAGSIRWLLEAIADAPAELDGRLGAGMLVGRYRLIEAIGRGGFGVVFKAVDTELGREIALKLLAPGRRGGDAEARLMREAQAMARLSHPNVLTIYDVGTFDGGVFIAMELVHGGTLARWMKSPRPWREVIDVLARAGRGLEAAHRAGLVHRDFKPENVLVGDDGRVHVTDFGVARLMSDPSGASSESAPSKRGAPPEAAADAPLTRTGMLLGTPAYMAPEQMNGEPSDVRADVFSFCVACWEALHHERPFAGPDLAALKSAIAAHRLSPPSSSSIPARVRRVLARGLHPSPNDRFPTMAALLSALAAAARPRRAPLIAASLALVAVAAVAATYFARRPVSAAPPPPSPALALEPHPSAGPSTPSPSPAAPQNNGTLIIRTNVDSARIELDGTLLSESARTARVTVDATREHHLRVSAPGYRPLKKTIRVAPNATVEAPVTLARPSTPTPAPAPATPARPADDADPNAAIDPYRQNGHP